MRLHIEALERRLMLAVDVPAGFADERYAGGFDAATSMAFLPDGRLLVATKAGALHLVRAGGATATNPVLTVATNTDGERGLIGVAVDPQFATNGYIYVHYVTPAGGFMHTRVSRFTMTGDTAAGEVVLIESDARVSAYHNGGAVDFGPDGKLYVAIGDDTRTDRAQRLDTLDGKILRINRDGSVPTDNPFYGQATGKYRAIWATGLRNPFTLAVQAGTGRMIVNDVGQATFEEVNVARAGANYGWPDTEGPTTDPRFDPPVFAYGRPGSGGAVTGTCVIGGAFATGQFPAEYAGDYFFGDLNARWIKRLEFNPDGSVTVAPFGTAVDQPVDFAVSPAGYIYYLTYNSTGGEVRRIRHTASLAPAIADHPDARTRSVGQPVTFTADATGAAPLAYQWQRDGADIPGATGRAYTIDAVTAADDGAAFRVRVTNAYGTATSDAATLTVTSNTAPTPTITAPAVGARYTAGQTLTFGGSATDAEDGTLPPGAFTWEVVFHHDDHTHPFMPPRTGVTSGSVVIPTSGETSANVFYRVRLTVTDSGGLTRTVTRDVRPTTTTVTLATNVPGLGLRLDGQPLTAPATFTGVVGIVRQLAAPRTQSHNGESFVFVGWSDGQPRTHAIRTPGQTTTYTATYRLAGTVAGAGGLRGVYFDNADLTGRSLTRTDAAVNFNWGAGSPSGLIAPDTFSARWVGQVRAARTERYTFHTTTDDGVRLWVDDRLLIDRWAPQAATEHAGSIDLVAGQRYDLRLEYFEAGGSAAAQLRWSGPSTPKQVVPTSALFSSRALPAAGLVSTDVGSPSPAGRTTTRAPGVAADLFGGGPGTGGAADAVRFAYRLVAGDFDVAARVTGLDDTGAWARAGLMVRESLAAGSRNAFTFATPTTYRFSYRETTGGAPVGTGSATASFPNVWLRLRRVGDALAAFRSTDGAHWAPIGSATLDLPDVVYVGLAATSGTAAAGTTARFRQVG